jgi:hypothetical protein
MQSHSVVVAIQDGGLPELQRILNAMVRPPDVPPVSVPQQIVRGYTQPQSGQVGNDRPLIIVGDAKPLMETDYRIPIGRRDTDGENPDFVIELTTAPAQARRLRI